MEVMKGLGRFLSGASPKLDNYSRPLLFPSQLDRVNHQTRGQTKNCLAGILSPARVVFRAPDGPAGGGVYRCLTGEGEDAEGHLPSYPFGNPDPDVQGLSRRQTCMPGAGAATGPGPNLNTGYWAGAQPNMEWPGSRVPKPIDKPA